MNARNYLLIMITAVFCCVIYACDDEENFTNISMTSQQLVMDSIAYPKKQGITRSLPLENNWENWEYVTLHSGAKPYTPWNPKISSAALPYDIRMDIKAEDGWDLIAHSVNSTIGDNGQNYLVFHNKFTGVLKVFYYLEADHAQLQNNGIWKLIFEAPQSFLAFQGEYAKPISKANEEIAYVENITTDDSKGFSVGWNCFQIELAYDPDFSEGTLQIIASSLENAEINLSGDFDSETKGWIINATQKNKFSNIINGVAGLSGDYATNWLKEEQEKNNFSSNLKNVLIDGAKSIVTNGISSLLGSFLGGFNQTKQTVQSVQLKTNGKINISGTIHEVRTGLVSPLNMSISTKDVGKLGAWNMKDDPYITANPYSTHRSQDPTQTTVHIYNVFLNRHYSDVDKLFTINPEIQPYINSYSVNYHVYHSTKEVLNLAFKDKGYFPQYHLEKQRGKFLYNDLSEVPLDNMGATVYIYDENGEVINNLGDDAPYEIFLATAPDGTAGACPDFNCPSHYILSVEVTFHTKNGGTVVSNHMFPLYMKWDLNSYRDGLYNILYPAVPYYEDNIR